MSNRYTFTSDQLTKVLNEAIGLFLEFRDQHGKSEDEAQPLAVSEVLEGLDAERELLAHADLDRLTLQEQPLRIREGAQWAAEVEHYWQTELETMRRRGEEPPAKFWELYNAEMADCDAAFVRANEWRIISGTKGDITHD